MNKILGSAAILISITLPALAFGQASELAKAVEELADKLAFASKGQVLTVEGERVYLDLRKQAGIRAGTRFEVAHPDAPSSVGGRGLGYAERVIAEIEIAHVGEAIAIARVIEQERPFETGDRVYQHHKNIRRVAVTEFPYADTFNDFTKLVRDRLDTNLVQRRMLVMERGMLQKMQQEFKIPLRTLGVEGLVVGRVDDLGDSVAIAARLIDVENGNVITGARVVLSKTDGGSRKMREEQP